MKVVNSRLLFAICCASALSGSDQDSRAENVRTQLPQIATGLEAVTKVFDVKGIRSLEPPSFEPLRMYFSARQRRDIDEYLRALDQLTVTRSRVAREVGIKDEWWWPADIGTTVHMVIKNDPLTDRASVPDEVTISGPRLHDRKLRITVNETYKGVTADGTDLGGTKSSKVTLVPAEGRWVIDQVVFTVSQYGKTTVTSLDEILARNTKQLRLARQKIENRKFDVRTARPVSR